MAAKVSRLNHAVLYVRNAKAAAANRRRASTVEKSRTDSLTDFFSFQTVSTPRNTAEIWVSIGSAPARERKKAATSVCSGGIATE